MTASFSTARLPRSALRADSLALVCMLCGACIAVRVELVGEAFLVELLIPWVALVAVIARGTGQRLSGRVLLLYLSAGTLTFTGYLISDLFANNDAWQYVRGWGRVLLLLTDCVAMILLVAQGARNLWWFILGVGAGGIAWLLATGVSVGTWKIGYGEYTAFVCAALAGLLPRYLAAAPLLACAVASLLLDYRSLGATCMLSAGLLLVAGRRRATRPASEGRRWLKLGVLMALCVAALAVLLHATQDAYDERRKLSNGGRYIGVAVALRAIANSPLIGYGSWAEEGEFAQMLRNEAGRLERELGRKVEVGRSLLPHSQLLQAWVEGGVLGAAFFLLYGAGLLLTLRWFVVTRARDWLTGAAIFALMYGLWNFAASPFLGFTRVYIAIAVGVIAVASWERGWLARQARAKPKRRVPALSAAWTSVTAGPAPPR